MPEPPEPPSLIRAADLTPAEWRYVLATLTTMRNPLPVVVPPDGGGGEA